MVTVFSVLFTFFTGNVGGALSVHGLLYLYIFDSIIQIWIQLRDSEWVCSYNGSWEAQAGLAGMHTQNRHFTRNQHRRPTLENLRNPGIPADLGTVTVWGYMGDGNVRREGSEFSRGEESIVRKMEAMVRLGPIAAPGLDADALFEGAGEGNLGVFQKLSEEDVKRARLLRNEDERTLLHVAAASGRIEVVKWVVEGVSDTKGLVNVSDEEGWTALHSAVSSGRDAVVEVLLALGADVGAANKGGRTALHYAASKNHVEIAHALIKAGAKVNRKDGVGCTPLHRAASAGHAEMCEVLLEAGADIEATDRMGQTPLMHAVICDNRRVAFLLVRHDADVDAQDKEEYTVLGRASQEFRPLLIDAAKAMMGDS